MPGQSGPGSNGNEGVLCIPQIPSITGTPPSDCLMLYLGHSLGGSCPSAEMQSVYSTAPADRATNGPGDLGSIPGRVIPKIQKMVLDASLLNTQHYKVRIKGKVGQSGEGSSALPYTSVK